MEEKLDSRIPKTFYYILILFLSIKGHINFLQLARFSQRCESGFRYFFEKPFDFFNFNKQLIQLYVKNVDALAFDPSYISKSGTKTHGVGYFWSGVDSKSKWGLELCGLAVIDKTNKTAYHLNAFQTTDLKEQETLINFYTRNILEQSQELLKISKYLVADAYFSKVNVVNPLKDVGFHIISRLRDDAALRYLYKGQQQGRGRPKLYDKKVIFKNLDKDHAKLVSQKDKELIYNLKVNSIALKQTINLVIVYTKNKKGKWIHKNYFSTDLEQDWKDILELYRLRFQIEFLYRDAKQHTGLNDCQARSKNKLHFHWNMSLTAINIAKITHWLPLKKKNPNIDIPFSMSNIKTLYNNKLFLDLFISMFGIRTELNKNKTIIQELTDFGKII